MRMSNVCRAASAVQQPAQPHRAAVSGKGSSEGRAGLCCDGGWGFEQLLCMRWDNATDAAFQQMLTDQLLLQDQ